MKRRSVYDHLDIAQKVQQPGVKQHKKHWYARFLSPLWLSLLVAVLVRVVLIIHTNATFDGDEALVAIQAQHILQGQFPAYFYGIPYFGSLEAYLLALVFATAGSSAWTLRAEPTLLSLVIVWLTWRLATVLTEDAGLPSYARKCFIFIAALLAAVPPLYDTSVELRTWGGYVETFVLMLLLLLSAAQLIRRWRAGACLRELAWRWAGIGLVVGLGLWVDPLIISAVIGAALWILWNYAAQFVALKWQASTDGQQPIRLVLKSLIPSTAAIPGCVVGLLPAILWGATHQWANITYVLRLGSSFNPVVQARYSNRLDLARGLAGLYTNCVGPRIISGAVPYENTNGLPLFTPATLHAFTLVVGVVCIFMTVGLVALSFLWHHPWLVRIRQIAAFPLTFGVCSALLFCITTVAASGLNSCNNDLAGRYAVPLMLVLPFFFATAFTCAVVSIYEMGKRKRRITDETPVTSQSQPPVATARAYFFTGARIVVFAFFALYLLAQVDTYLITDTKYTFLSPFCLDAPTNLDLDPIITYLQQEHIHYAWGDGFVAYSIVFKTHGAIMVDDPRPPFVHNVYLIRFPANVEAIKHANRPSLIVFVLPGDAHPTLLKILDAEHVIYRVKRFPSEPFIDVLVVTPLNRTVSPFESETVNVLFRCL